MTLSMAYSKSFSLTERPLCLAACKAASFTMLAMSAPGERGEGGGERGERERGRGREEEKGKERERERERGGKEEGER